MSVFFNLLFIIVNFIDFVSPIDKITYINGLSANINSYRLLYIDKLIVLSDAGVFSVTTSDDGSTINADNSFSADLITTTYSSHIEKLENGNFVIAGTSTNKVIMFDSLGTDQGQNNLDNTPALDQGMISVSYFDGFIIIGFIDDYSTPTISLYEISSGSLSTLQSFSTIFDDSNKMTFQCRTQEQFKSNGEQLYFCIFSLGGSPIISFIIFTSLTDNFPEDLITASNNILGTLFEFIPGTTATDGSDIYLKGILVYYTDDSKLFYQIIVPEMQATITFNTPVSPFEETKIVVTSLDDLCIYEKGFVVVVNGNTILFYNLNVNTLEIESLSVITYSQFSSSGVFITLKDDSSYVLLTRTVGSSEETVYYFNRIYCIDKTQAVVTDITLQISPTILADTSTTENLSLLQIQPKDDPSGGIVYGVKSDGTKEDISTLVGDKPIYSSLEFISSSIGTFSFTFSLFYPIDTTAYIPSGICTISITITQNPISLCDITKAIVLDDGRCIDILGGVSIGKDSKNNKYYMFNYINLTSRELKQYYKKILALIDSLIKNDQTTTTGENVSITYINLNGVDYSFYYLKGKNAVYLPKNATSIDLLTCSNILQDKYSITEDDIYINQYDFEPPQSESVQQTEYDVTDSSQTFLDLNYCKKASAQVQVSYPLASTELAQEGYLDIGYNLSQQGIDIFNCDDPFYNDICFPFTGERERDITIEDRRIEYYPNFTLCENNCTYIRVNYTTNYSICLCDAKTDVIVERNDTTDEYHFKFSDALPKTNLLVVKCANTIFNTKLFYRNIGFWIQLILLVTITTLLIVFFAKRNTMIQSVIKKIIIYSKPTMKIIKFKKDSSKYVNYVNANNSNSIDFSTKMNNNNQSSSLFSGVSKVNVSSFIYNHNSSFDNSMTAIKDSIQKNKVTTPTNLSDDNSNDKPKINTNIHNQSLLERTYWNILKIHHTVINIILKKAMFNHINIRIAFYLSGISLSLASNAMLYTQDTVHDNYYTKFSINALSYIITHQILKSLFSFLICITINIPMHFLAYGYHKVDIISSKAINKFDKVLLEKETKTAHTKLIIYFIINSIFLLFYLYYTAAFCAVYYNSQISWLEGCVISIVIGLVQPFITGLLLFFLDRCSRKTNLVFISNGVNRLLE